MSTTPPSSIPPHRLGDQFDEDDTTARLTALLSSSSTTAASASSLPTSTASRRSITAQNAILEAGTRPVTINSSLQLNQPLFVLDGHFISQNDAVKFHAQAYRNPTLSLNEVTTVETQALIDMAIFADQDITCLDETNLHLWEAVLNLKQVADLVLKYFGAVANSSRTLAENFADVPFHYSLEDHFFEMTTYLQYTELTRSYLQQGHTIPMEQHKQLIAILEKRILADSQIKSDYLRERGPVPLEEEWSHAMRRFLKVMGKARAAIKIVKMYGNVKDIISYPMTATPPRNPNAKIKLATRDPTTGLSTAPLTLAKRHNGDMLPPLHRSAVCRSCGSSEHSIQTCPALYWSDSNTDHDVDWDQSKLGKLWKSFGYRERQKDLVLPGYEFQSLLKPLGTAPGQLNSSKSNKRSNDDSVNNNDVSFDEDNINYNKNKQAKHSSNDNRGSNTKYPSNNNKGGGGRGGGNNNSNRYNNQGRGNNQGGSNKSQSSASSASDVTTSESLTDTVVLASVSIQPDLPEILDDETLVSNITQCTILPAVQIDLPVETILSSDLTVSHHKPSDFLSVTIFIPQSEEDMESAKTEDNMPGIPAQALLDTGSLAGDFISQDLVLKLNALHLCYTSPVPLMVCSGLDGICYSNKTVLNIGINFKSFNNVDHIIFLTVRVNPRSKINLILGRSTINKYTLFKLTPFAFGISPDIGEVVTENIDSNIVDIVDNVQPFVQERFLTTILKHQFINDDNMNVSIPEPSNSTPCGGRCSHNANILRDFGQPTQGLETPSISCQHCNYAKFDSCLASMEVINPVTSCDEGLMIMGGVTHPMSGRKGETPPEDVISSNIPSDPTILLANALDTCENHPSGVVISNDEIDNDKTDTFGPFLHDGSSDTPPVEGSEDFLLHISFEGDEDLQKKCKLLCLKYRHLFSNAIAAKPALLKPFKLRVNKKEWERSVNRGPLRPHSAKKEAEIKRAIDEMLASGVIEPSDAVYYSHPVIVQKTADLFRFCIDYRNLNACIDPASFPLPNVKGLFERIGRHHSDIFGVLDLTAGYHQAPLDVFSRIFTAFLCFAGIFQFTRLPFGPRCAPSYFQEQMATVVLNGLIYMICEIYIDDIIVYGQGPAEFLERLERVFERLSAHGILLKAKKCKLGRKSIEYVGRTVCKDGLSMSTEKINSVLDFPRPDNLTALRALLGLANYFRQFVPNHSTIVAPLQHMVDHKAHKKSAIEWTTSGLKAFQEIRIAISRCPLMFFIDDVSPIRLYTDASDYGIGGVLVQIVDGEWRPIAFISKSLSSTQLNWSTIQKEAYAIFFCCQQLDYLIRDRKFEIFTDHKNITYMKQTPTSMVSRWFIAMQELDFTVNFVKGSQNVLADGLSRLCPNNAKLALPLLLPDLEFNGSVMSAVVTAPPPTDEQLECLEQCHNSIVGHGGSQRTLTKLFSLGYTWLHMRQHVNMFIKSCPLCQKMSAVKYPVEVQHYVTISERPFDIINVDFLGPFPDKTYVLVIIDNFSKWVELYHCTDATAKSACEGLLHHFGRFGAPNMVRSDKGSHFANDLIKEFLSLTGTPHNLTLSYSKQENAIVERANKEVNRHLRALAFTSTSIDNYRLSLPFVQRIINSSLHNTTGVSPANMLFGNRINLDRGILTPFPPINTTTKTSDILANMIFAQDQIMLNAIQKVSLAKARHLVSNAKPLTIFPVGSYVLALYPAGPPTRLHTKWQGPCKVLSHILSEYKILNIITKVERTVFAGTLKPFLFDPKKTTAEETARRDYMEFFIEAILDHRGDLKRPSTLTFLVKWLNYDDAHNSWEPWNELRKCDVLHDFIRNNVKYKALIPKIPKLDS